MPKTNETRLISEFKGRESFSREELFNFFRLNEPDLKTGTLGWRIFDLKNKNIIRPLRRGLYVISSRYEYLPAVSEEILKLAKEIYTRFKDVRFCIWNTLWFNEFSVHQSVKGIIIIEFEKEYVETLFYELKDNFKSDFFLDPDQTVMNLYVFESNSPVIIRRLVTRSPVSKRTEKKVKLFTPMLEKMLVDLFSDDKQLYFYQGHEMINIYESALRRYSINFSRLFSYARRKGKEAEIKSFIENNMNHIVKNIFHD
jgi:hypothetical protein